MNSSRLGGLTKTLKDNNEPDIRALVLGTTPSYCTRESLLDELVALKAIRDKGSQRRDSVRVKVGCVGNFDPDEKIGVTLQEKKVAKPRTLEKQGSSDFME